MSLRKSIFILVVLTGAGFSGAKAEISPGAQCSRLSPGKQCGVIAEEIRAVYRSPEGETLEVLFNTRLRTATVELSGERTLRLPQVISASGARYSDGENTFWEHQGEGSFWVGGELLFSGKSIAQPD